MTDIDYFPARVDALSLSLAKQELLLEGMRVKFDQTATLVPADLVERGQAPRYSRAKGFDKKHCTIYIVATPKLQESIDMWVESKSGFVASIRNYVEDIYHDYNGLSNFKIKLVESLDIPDFDPALDARIYLRRTGKNAAYNFSNANVNLDFFGSGTPGTANGCAYLVAHEALHTYMARLGVLLFASFDALTPNTGGHLDQNHKGEYYPNLLMDGQVSANGGGIAKYDKYSSEGRTFLRDFRRIHPVQKHFLKDAHRYLSLAMAPLSTEPKYRARLDKIKQGSAPDQKDVGSPSFMNMTIPEDSRESYTVDFGADPETLTFR